MATLNQIAPDLLRVCREIYEETQHPRISCWLDFENWVEEQLEGVLKKIEAEEKNDGNSGTGTINGGQEG